MAPWRVLVYDKWRRFAPPDKHTPPQNHQAERKARAKRSFALNRLRNLPLFRSRVFLSLLDSDKLMISFIVSGGFESLTLGQDFAAFIRTSVKSVKTAQNCLFLSAIPYWV